MADSRRTARVHYPSWVTAPSFVPHCPSQPPAVATGEPSTDRLSSDSTADQSSLSTGSGINTFNSPRTRREVLEGCRVCLEWTNVEEAPVSHNLPSEWFGNACSGLQQHLDSVPHTRWEMVENHDSGKAGWRHDSSDCDQTFRIDDRAMHSYQLAGIANLSNDVERELEIMKQILADVNLQVRKFHHRWSARRNGQERSVEKFVQTQAYHGASSKDDVVEPWQIHARGEVEWRTLQSRVLGHPLLSIASKMKIKSELLRNLRWLRGQHQFDGTHKPEVSRRVSYLLNGVLGDYLRDHLKGFLPLDHLYLHWNEKGRVEVVRWEKCEDWSFAVDQSYDAFYTHFHDNAEGGRS